MNNLTEYYERRIQQFLEKELVCIKKEKKFPLIRLLTIAFSVASFYLLFQINLFIAILVAIIFLVIFIAVAIRDLKNTEERKKFEQKRILNENEIKTIHGDYSYFENGHQFKNPESIDGDLDIFGESSLFHSINRTTLDFSRNILAEWLSNPESKAEIKARNKAVAELKDKVDLRQEIFTIGKSLSTRNKNDVRSLVNWLKDSKKIYFSKSFVAICTILSVITVSSAILSFFFLPSAIVTLMLIIHFFIAIKANATVQKCHAEVNSCTRILNCYSEIISKIENEKFESEKLLELKEMLKSEELTASLQINKLRRILNNLDYRYNFLVSIFLNVFLFWDIHQIYKLQIWKNSNQSIDKWFRAVGEFESLSSFANLYFNNPDWCFPKINEVDFILEAKKLGHPLIVSDKRVCNDFNIQGNKIIILTGSNMSGKSTFLRTIGINYVLAMAGSAVCASEYNFTPTSILSSMRISDSLKDNTSSFYAELKKIAAIIKVVESKQKAFLLLDEILRGTNSNDRHLGSVALIKQLIKYNAVGIIATHDLKIAELVHEFPEYIENYNFDIKINQEELYFDYALNKGICTSLNASLLMKKMGINI